MAFAIPNSFIAFNFSNVCSINMVLSLVGLDGLSRHCAGLLPRKSAPVRREAVSALSGSPQW
jgi:hypothetical protein